MSCGWEEQVTAENANNKSKNVDTSPWPDTTSDPVVFLLDARDELDEELVQSWVDRHRPDSDPVYAIVRLSNDGIDATLSNHIDDAAPATWMQPVRVAWLPSTAAADHNGVGNFFVRLIAAFGKVGRRFIARRYPERLAYIRGDGATLEDLSQRHFAGTPAGAPCDDLPRFIAGQAMIALERSERTVRGARYKIPKILPAEVFANATFKQNLSNIAQQRDRSIMKVVEKAAKYLQEMAAMQTPRTLDVMMSFYRIALKSHHDEEIDVVDEQLKDVNKIMSERPVVFLISHKSMLDTAALSKVLFDANLPLPLTFGGINLRTPGFGALARRSGIIFLRRSFQDNEIYKLVFRRYIDYLIEKRFSLLWALEGTRSRTGKLLPPRFGLFNYVIESILRTRLYNVTFVPVSVAYDQITEVEDYAIEQRGKSKKAEGATWAVRFLKRGKSRGKIHLRFGEPLTLPDIVSTEKLDAGISDEKKQILVPTVAFEVAVRMNAATPITDVAIITLILLAGGNRAMSLEQVQSLARSGVALIKRRKLEIVGHSDFRDDRAVRATLDELHQTGILNYLDDGIERLYAIGDDQHLNAAYYRNTAIHYFVLDAVVEIALLAAAESDGDRVTAFLEKAERLRDIFKFEFYFPRRAGYRQAIESLASERFGDWEGALSGGETAVKAKLGEIRPLLAHVVLRSFVDAYRVVARVLVAKGADAVSDESALLTQCLKTGKQQLLQGRVFSAESVSKTLYGTGLKLAGYRGLLGAGKADARHAFHQELVRIEGRLDDVLSITVADAKEL